MEKESPLSVSVTVFSKNGKTKRKRDEPATKDAAIKKKFMKLELKWTEAELKRCETKKSEADSFIAQNTLSDSLSKKAHATSDSAATTIARLTARRNTLAKKLEK